jgi:polyisoprenoid-binding protein YceI
MKKLMLIAFLVSLSLTAAEIDTSKSTLGWKGSKGAAGFKLGSHYGKIKIESGDFEVEDGNLVGGNVVVDMTDFTVEDLSGTWAEKFISHMKSSDFFKTDKFKNSKLKIKSVNGKKVTADLTINGKTNEVNFDYKKEGDAFVGKLVFDRTKYGMNYGDDESLGDKFIHHEVEVDFKIYTK